MQSFAYVGQKPPKMPIFTKNIARKRLKPKFDLWKLPGLSQMPHEICNYDYLSSFCVPIQNYEGLDIELRLKPSIFRGQRSQYAKYMQFGF